MNGKSTHDMALRDLRQHAELDLFSEFHASNMAAGPCARAAALDGQRFKPGEAPIPPFVDCPHPDQCACMYRAALTADGEF